MHESRARGPLHRKTGLILAANAVGLIVAAIALDRVRLNAVAFILAVVISTVEVALMTPFLAPQLRRHGSAALGGVAMIGMHPERAESTAAPNGRREAGSRARMEAAGCKGAKRRTTTARSSLLATFLRPSLYRELGIYWDNSGDDEATMRRDSNRPDHLIADAKGHDVVSGDSINLKKLAVVVDAVTTDTVDRRFAATNGR